MIETRALKESVDLLAIARRDTRLRKVASSNGGEYAGSCPFCGGEDRFRVQPLACRWLCRGCTDGRWQDVIEYVQRRDGLDFLEACHRLNSGTSVSADCEMATMRQREPETAPNSDWQNETMVRAVDCADRLKAGAAWIVERSGGHIEAEGIPWEEAPAEARAHRWLMVHRGLWGETIRSALLGYNPDWDDGLPPGITIPCFAGRGLPLWYLKVRTFRKDLDKYLFLKGSVGKALFQANTLLKRDHAVIVEGELDALLLHQHAGDLVAVVTMGSAGSVPDAIWRPYLALLRGAFIAMDRDIAGHKGTSKWEKSVPWLRPMPPFTLTEAIPFREAARGIGRIKDVTDYWANGGDLRQWVRAALHKAEGCEEG